MAHRDPKRSRGPKPLSRAADPRSTLGFSGSGGLTSRQESGALDNGPCPSVASSPPRTRSAAGLDGAAQTARSINRNSGRMCPRPQTHRGRASFATGQYVPEVGLHQCPLDRSFYFDETHVIDTTEKFSLGVLCYWLQLGRIAASLRMRSLSSRDPSLAVASKASVRSTPVRSLIIILRALSSCPWRRAIVPTPASIFSSVGSACVTHFSSAAMEQRPSLLIR